MKVKELILKLQGYPEDAEVCMDEEISTCRCCGTYTDTIIINGGVSLTKLPCTETDPAAVKNDKGKIKRYLGEPFKFAVLIEKN